MDDKDPQILTCEGKLNSDALPGRRHSWIPFQGVVEVPSTNYFIVPWPALRA